ncbi:hypothetical protein [Propionispora hippei]|uniref:hypothetical protein n=1 Tax=Propionispora hippei TaxID=209080 RepID=UPI00122C45A3|nr:hypothetical protein [Propionispora hippei]
MLFVLLRRRDKEDRPVMWNVKEGEMIKEPDESVPAGDTLHRQVRMLGKISDKSSYKNLKNAIKSTKFFTNKQAPRKPAGK